MTPPRRDLRSPPPKGGAASGPAEPVPRRPLGVPLILRKLFRRRIVLGAAIALSIVVLVSLLAGPLVCTPWYYLVRLLIDLFCVCNRSVIDARQSPACSLR